MTGGNAELVREAYKEIDRKGVEAFDRWLDPEVEYVNPDYAVETGTLRGPEDFRAAFDLFFDNFDEVHTEIAEIAEAGDRVVVATRIRGRLRGSQVPLEISFGHLLTLRDGKLVRFEWFTDPEEAFTAAGLRRGEGG